MKNERGVALVITLFLMGALSALAVSLVFLSQTETSSSRNYKTMSQARYAAEAGVHRAVNYLLLDSFKTSMVANLASFDLTQSPVKYNGADVVLSASSGVSSNYPDATVTSAFTTGVKGTLAVGLGYSAYSASAKLLSMRTVNVYGSAPDIIMTWRITGTGAVCRGSATCAISDSNILGTLDVTATLERDLNNAQTYAVFATSQTCGALTISGNASTDSFNSATMTTTPPTTVLSGGGVGTNGNLDVGGSVDINGTLSTPRTGAGTCSASNPNAITGVGSWQYDGTTQLAQAVAFPTPTIPSGIPTSNITLSAGDGTAGCNTKLTTAGVIGWTCTVTGSSMLLTPPASPAAQTLALGNVTIGANTDLTIGGGTAVTLNVNSFHVSNNATMTMTSSPNTTITMNIAGQALGATNALDVSGNAIVNSTYDPTRFQILYAGTGEMDVVGTGMAAVTIYAPNAYVKTAGNGSVYGSILSGTFKDVGSAKLHYDTALQKKYQTLGNYAMSSFSWRKY